MAKIKFTKTELKSQQDALKQFVRFLPTLQLKKQQLQMEVRLSTEELERNLAEQKELVDRMSSFLELFSSDAEVAFFEGLVRVRRVLTGEENIAGIAIPTFDRVEFEPADWDLFDTEWYVDDAVQALKDAVSLREAYKVLEEQHPAAVGGAAQHVAAREPLREGQDSGVQREYPPDPDHARATSTRVPWRGRKSPRRNPQEAAEQAAS